MIKRNVALLFIVVSLAGSFAFADKRVPTPAEILVGFGVPLTPDGVTGALRHANGLVRQSAATQLGEWRTSTAVVDLKGVLNDEYVYARIAAAGALLKMKDQSGVAVLTSELSNVEVVIAVAASNELLASGDTRAFEGLLGRLDNCQVPSDRLLLVRAIARYGSFADHRPRVEKALIARLLHDEGKLVRMVAAEELADYRSDAAQKALLTAAETDNDPIVRGVARASVAQKREP